MYRVFNMGHRMELYVEPAQADDLIAVAKTFNVEAQVIGRVEAAAEKQVTIRGAYGEFVYS